jgi:DNA-binding winged helix-turn-helix (wHTH) protein
MLQFGPISLDEEAGRVRHGGVERPLRAKSFAVLGELVRRRGRLVTKEELFRRVWPDTAVSPTVLRVCISEIRALLLHDGTGAIAIEAVGRRGYRMVVRGSESIPSPAPLIGRDREMAALRRALADAGGSQRQTVLVSGESGLGKTTLLEYFIEEIQATTRARVAWGQCVELTRGTEPYLPVLHLLGRLCADDSDGAVVEALERWAPSWLVQMPGLVEGAKAEALRRRLPNPNRDRMLRELGEVFEALAVERPLILVVEDLHWSDVSSVDALAYVAQCIAPARLLLIGSYRPADLALDCHPLLAVKRKLVARRRATDISLSPLSAADVNAYLLRRLEAEAVDREVADAIHARTSGNPLFMTCTVDSLLERGILAARQGRWYLAAPALAIAHEQGARLWAARAAESLATPSTAQRLR